MVHILLERMTMHTALLARNLALWSLVAGTLASLGAEEISLPATRSLESDLSSLRLAVERTVLEVRIDAEATPSLTAKPLEKTDRQAFLEIERQGRELFVRRQLREPEGQATVVLALTIRPEQSVQLLAKSSDVTLSAPVSEAGDEPDAPREDGKTTSGEDLEGRFENLEWKYDLELTDSSAVLVGLEDVRLKAVEGVLHLRSTVGGADVRVAGTEVEIDGHAGALRLTGSEGELQVTEHHGDLGLELEACRLVVIGGESRVEGRLRGGWTQLVDWRGQAQLRGSGAVLEVLRAGSAESELKLEGGGLDVRLDQWEGVLSARLEGGSLRGANLVGPVEVAGRSEAFVELAEVRGDVELELESGASAQVSDVPWKLVAELRDSRLDSERIGDLQLVAERSELTGTGVTRLGRAKATDSRLELDLAEINHDPALVLRGATTARIRLPLPCEVRLVQVGELGDERADVAGCKLRVRSEVAERFEAETLVEDAVKLVASVAAESSLVVRGVSRP